MSYKSERSFERSMIPHEYIEELTRRTDIVELVGSYVQLKRKGRLYGGLCPFHSEKTPSFYVYPDTQSFYCFGCGAGGDAITFTKKINSIDYPEAVKLLAARAGMPEPQEDDKTGRMRSRILSMNKEAARFFHACLNSTVEEARQARHDLRHQLCQLAALAEEGNLEKIKAYLSGAVSRIPSLELHFCENRAADGVVGYYCALAKRENIPYSVQIDLPECLPVDEINLCLVLSNLLENALEASLRTAPARRKIKLTAYLHSGSLALIQVENTYDGVIREKGGVFQSSKRKGDGVGLQSVRHIAEKSGGVSTVTYQDGLFCAKVMLRG